MYNAKTVVEAVFDDCKAYLSDYFDGGVVVGLAFALVYCLILVYQIRRSQGNLMHNIFWGCMKLPFAGLLGIYGYLVLAITILFRDTENRYIFKWIPFATWGTDPWSLSLWVENILMMVPLGILLYILWKPFRKIGWSLLAGGLFSLAIECTQLFMRIGKFETDDIMNNMFGTLLGFLCCKVIDVVTSALYTLCKKNKD